MTDKEKVLVVGWGYPPKIDGGLDIHVSRLYQQLQKREDVEADLVIPENRLSDRSKDVMGVYTGEDGMFLRSRRLSREVAELAESYDVVHTHDWFGVEAGFKAQKYSEVDWVSTFHSLSCDRTRSGSGKQERLEKVGVEEADKVLAVSEMLSDKIKSNFGICPEVVYNGFSNPSSTGMDVKEELDISGRMFFFVGRHSEQKGVKNLLYGFKKYLEDNNDEDLCLVVGGDGHLRSSLEEFVEILGVEDRVVFTGFIEESVLGDFYACADVFISPSINEPFGLTITEAVKSGTTVLATENGAEEILPGDMVERIEPHSESIKKGLEKAESLEKNRGDLDESRSWSDMADELVEIYKSV